MQLYSDINSENFRQCEYLKNKNARLEYFFAAQVNREDLDVLLSSGWRKFSYFYFRPSCLFCYQCEPIRVLVQELDLSKNQRRLLRKNDKLHVKFTPLCYSDEIFAIYQDHSWNRFRQNANRQEFKNSFYRPSCQSLQSEYYLRNKLVAVGFLDFSSNGLSSCYFIYDTKHSDLSLGTYSILVESRYAASLNLKYYYLGYYIGNNRHMCYKNRFYPHEILDWHELKWRRHDR